MIRMFLLGVLAGTALGGLYVTNYGAWGFLICVAPAAALLIATIFLFGYHAAESDAQADRETERS